MSQRVNMPEYLPSLILGLCLLAGCGKSSDQARTQTLLTAESPVPVSNLVFPTLVRDSRGALIATLFIHSSFPSAIQALPAIQVLRSHDRGTKWQAVSTVPSPVTYGVWGYDLKIDGRDRLYLTWVAAIYDPQIKIPFKAIMFARSDDGGRSWTAPISVTTARSGQRISPCLSVGEKTVAVAWLEEPTRGSTAHRTRSISQDVYLATSRDFGTTWSPPVCLEGDLNNKDSTSSSPSVCLGTDDRIYCSFFSIRKYSHRTVGGVWLARSDEQGSQLTTQMQDIGPLGEVYMTEQQGNLQIITTYLKGIRRFGPPSPQTTQEIRFYTVSADGKTWSKPVIVDDDESHTSKQNLRLVPVGQNRWLAGWHDQRGGVYLAVSCDGGKSWGKNLQVAPASSVGNTPLDLVADPASGSFFLLTSDIHKGAGDATYLVRGQIR